MEVDTLQEKVKTTKTVQYFELIYKYVYLVGWPNFLTTKPDVPAIFIKYHGILTIFLDICCYSVIVLQISAFFTQKNLTEKQKSIRDLFTLAQFFLSAYGTILTFYQKNVRSLTYCFTVELKKYYNDEAIEADMIKKARLHSTTCCIVCYSCIVNYGLDGLMQCFVYEGKFITVITGWPDVNDDSATAGYFRVIAYVMWTILTFRVLFTYVIIISTLVCLGFQYKNLQSYFKSLNEIFVNDQLTLKEKEEKYENGLKLGINMHARTVWCARECERSFMWIVSLQILFNIIVMMLLMVQMLNDDRTFASIAALMSTMVAMLLCTGGFMWNAGDVTVEAAALSNAMFSSGWQNCEGDVAVRVKKLLVIAMAQAQVPVTVRAFGTTALSYECYVSIVKASYSLFSVLY